MRRREFIAGIGSAAAWPVVARAQQQSSMMTIGFLDSRSSDEVASRLRAFAAITIGIVFEACLAASAPVVASVTITST
jgi:hypothetical protein